MQYRSIFICFIIISTLLSCKKNIEKQSAHSYNGYEELISNIINEENHLACNEGLIESYFHGNNFPKIPFSNNSILYELANPTEAADYSRLIVDNISETKRCY